MKGEDMLNRLLAYAQAFGKHGSGDDDYDRYAIAFQQKINCLGVEKILRSGGCVAMIEKGEDALS